MVQCIIVEGITRILSTMREMMGSRMLKRVFIQLTYRVRYLGKRCGKISLLTVKTSQLPIINPQGVRFQFWHAWVG